MFICFFHIRWSLRGSAFVTLPGSNEAALADGCEKCGCGNAEETPWVGHFALEATGFPNQY